jgi:type IV pilus assembly protein PilE
MKPSRGFTLVELMITVAVIAFLAAIAIPNYTDYVRRSRLSEAHAQLADLRVKMEQWFQDNRSYQGAGGACGVTMPAAAQLKSFDIACVAPSATTYTITATGRASVSLGGISFTINESNVKATAVTPASDMANNGYGANANCWVIKKGGSC